MQDVRGQCPECNTLDLEAGGYRGRITLGVQVLAYKRVSLLAYKLIAGA